MSKAFVIKNKEGKYLYEDGYVKFGEKLGYAHTEVEKEPLEKLIKDCKNILGDCQVVEVTIAEGDLEQELAEKDKEIEYWQQQATNTTNALTSDGYAMIIKVIHKQVCNEIREKLKMNKYNTCENTAFSVYYDYLKEILDQIEQAKESMKCQHTTK